MDAMSQVDPMDATAWRCAVEARLRFNRDLGITEYYRRDVPLSVQDALAAQVAATRRSTVAADSNQIANRSSTQVSTVPSSGAVAPAEVVIATESSVLFSAAPLAPAARAGALEQLRAEIGDCSRCKLHEGRNKLVFGDGDPAARLMFVGEGPGADEDAQGIPFVGRGGQLLNNMIGAMGLRRDQVYIANVVKCRPPGNRTPETDEGTTCSPFLMRQIEIVAPEVVVALGQTAVTWLTGQKRPLNAWRGTVHSMLGRKLIVTYHPAYLLRDPNQKKFAWEDLQLAMRELGLQLPQRG